MPSLSDIPGFGTKGRTRFLHTVNLYALRDKRSGIELGFLLDDEGRAVVVEYLASEALDPKAMRLVPLPKAKGGGSYVPIEVPHSCRWVDLIFRDGQGITLSDMSCRLHVTIRRFGPHGADLPLGAKAAAVAPPSPAADPAVPTPPKAPSLAAKTAPAPPKTPSLAPKAAPPAPKVPSPAPPAASGEGRSTFASALSSPLAALDFYGSAEPPAAAPEAPETAALDEAAAETPPPVPHALHASVAEPAPSATVAPAPVVSAPEPTLPAEAAALGIDEETTEEDDGAKPLASPPADGGIDLQALKELEPDLGHGPPGAGLFERQLNLFRPQFAGEALEMDLVVDDGGRAVALQVQAVEDEPPTVLAIARVGGNPSLPGHCSVRIPAGTERVALSFFDRQAQAMGELDVVYDLTSQRVLPPGSPLKEEELKISYGRGGELADFRLDAARGFGDEGVFLFDFKVNLVYGMGVDEGFELTWLLDDGGRCKSMLWWWEGADYASRQTLLRLTPMSPAVGTSLVPRGCNRVWVDFLDGKDRIVEELGCAFDLRKQILEGQGKRPDALSRDHTILERLRAAQEPCLVCKGDFPLSGLNRLRDQEEEVRSHCEEKHFVNWEYNRICETCLEKVQGELKLSSRLAPLLFGLKLVGRACLWLVAAYLGALLVYVAQGQWIMAKLVAMGLKESVAVAMAANLTAALVSLIPWGLIYRESNFFMRDWAGDALPKQIFLGVCTPLFFGWIVAGWWNSYALPKGFPPDTNPFLWSTILLAAGVGVGVRIAFAASAKTIWGRWQRALENVRKRFAAGNYLLREMGSMLEATQENEIYRRLGEALPDLLGVREFHLLTKKVDDEGLHYEPTASYGVELEELRGLKVRPGDANVLGQSAYFGQTYVRAELEASGEAARLNDPPLPSQMVFPIRPGGDQAEALVNVARFEYGRDTGDTREFLDTFVSVAGHALSNVHRLKQKDMALVDVREQMQTLLHEKDFVKTVFSRIVSPNVVDELLRNPDMLTPGGEKKYVTVFYSDIRSFTSMSEKMTPDQVVWLLNDYLEEMTRLCFKYCGTIDKFIGDAVMAFFGAPVHQPDHARRAVDMSIEMHKSLMQLNERWLSTPPFSEMAHFKGMEIGIGIHTGDVNVGFLGSKRYRVDYTVIGDTVNTAARLVSKAGAGEIVVSEETLTLLGSGYRSEEMAPMALKGKSEPVRAFQILY